MKKSTSVTTALCPAVLLALAMDGQATVSVPTSFGSGADTYLSNDSNSGPAANHGTEDLALREANSVRMRHIYIRFDISEISGDLSGATITLNGTGVNRGRPLNFYGVVDGATGGQGEAWDESTVTFATAAGVDPTTPLASEPIFTAEMTPSWVARTTTSVVGLNTTEPSTDLDTFIAADTDGLITFLVTLAEVDNDSESFFFTSKETGIAPVITFPNVVGDDSDGDGLTDDWEIANFGDLTSARGTEAQDVALGAEWDPDNDTFDNETEETAGSDPNWSFSIPGDIDGDELTDLWEDLYFGNNDGIVTETDLTVATGFEDPDGDHGTNTEEEAAGTDPRDYYSYLDNENLDNTGDGLNDWWETFFFGDLTTATDAFGDNDADTFSNTAEYDALSDPNDVASVPGDIDADTLNDLWEDRYFGDNDGLVSLADVAVTDDVDGDPDLDELTNKQEADGTPVGSDPNDPNSVPGDADADGLDDTWELTYFDTFDDDLADLLFQSGSDDSDGDLYTNEEEENAGTDPTSKDSFVDSEPDGLNDRWEVLVFGDLATASDPSADADSDLVTNYDEYLAGSDPTNQASVPDDTDADGLLDAFEITYFTSIALYDGDDDPDLDYATNEEEESALPFETDPTLRTSSPDTDEDFLGDGWEMFSFGDLTTTELETDDNDSDGFSNAEEYAAATNGSDPFSSPDTDGDGLPEGWERFYFTTETTQVGTDDSDNDGVINVIEFHAGTDPTLMSSVPSAGEATTAVGNGADTELSNDEQTATTGPDAIHGADGVVSIRNNQVSRLHIPMFRFDRSAMMGDLSNAVLRIHVPWSSGTQGVINVYGLIDGDEGENWAESTTNYANAPGIIEEQRSTLNIWARDPAKWVLLGTIQPTAVGVYYSNPTMLDLTSFLESDTDGVVTLAMDAAHANRWHGITMKEQGTDPAPAIILPLGTVVPPVESNPVITAVALDTAADPDTLTLTLGGLAAGQPYHIEGGVNLADFAPIVGSGFTAAGETEVSVLEVDASTNLKAFFRLAEGTEP